MVNVHYKSESERKITQTQTHSIIQTESEKSPPLQTRKKTYNHKHTPNTITCVHTHTHTHALPTSQLVKRKSTLGRFCQCCLTRDRATCRVRNSRCTEISAHRSLHCTFRPFAEGSQFVILSGRPSAFSSPPPPQSQV